MPNLDPQLAAEFTALEKLRLAVLQYREEVIDLQKSRGLATLSDIPRIELELPEEFQALINAASAAAPVAVAAPVAPPVVVPAPVVAPPVIAAPVSPAAAPRVETPATEQPEETFDEKVRTAPFAPITSPNQVYNRGASAAEPEQGLPARVEPARPATPEITEIKAAAATPAPMAPRISDATRTPTPAFSPTIPGRRPGMSQSMQIETVGSFLRRFRLAND